MSVAERLSTAKQRIAEACGRVGRRPEDVRIVAVTKTASEPQIIEAVNAGQLDLGESRAQVLESHAMAIMGMAGVRWHMIGHLQRNKVRDVLLLVHTIQSVDSLRLAQEIEKEADRAQKKIPILLQVNAGEEQQKFGVPMAQLVGLAEQMASMPHLELQGLMSMAPLTEDIHRVRETFARTREAFEEVRARGLAGDAFRELSMGMSGDYEIAIEQGATIIRLGSALFGTNA